MDGRAWWTAVHGVAKSLTRLSDFTFTLPTERIIKGTEALTEQEERK